jgi:hypothetical protein
MSNRHSFKPSISQRVCGCGTVIVAKRTGRKREYCSEKCRDAHRRQLNFDFFASTAHGQGKPRNSKNSADGSEVSSGQNGGRGSVINGLRKKIIDIEVIDPHSWIETVSSDGVVSFVTMLRPRALRNSGGAP